MNINKILFLFIFPRVHPIGKISCFCENLYSVTVVKRHYFISYNLSVFCAIMINLTQTNYPFYAYVPSRSIDGIFAVLVYISLIGWFVQSLCMKCRPTLLVIFIFMSHFTTFIELILRTTLDINLLNTKTLYRIRAPLLNVAARILLFANYQCLIELRGKNPRRLFDRIIEIVVPIGAITGDTLLTVADELSFKANHIHLSFHFRQASAAFILALSLLFYVVWRLSVSHVRRRYVLPLLLVSSTSVLIQAIYIQAISIPTVFFAFHQNEVWFFVGHLIPIITALITWTLCHPLRLLPPLERNVPHDESGKELLPPTSSI